MQALAGNTQGALEVAQRHGPPVHVLNVKGELAEEVVAENANHLIGSAARQEKLSSHQDTLQSRQGTIKREVSPMQN